MVCPERERETERKKRINRGPEDMAFYGALMACDCCCMTGRRALCFVNLRRG